MRTGDEGNRGISWLIMPMDSPGIEIQPLRTIEGTTEFAQLFLNEVRVPVANRVGEENDGWRVTMVTLSFERGTAFVGELLEAMRLLDELDDIGTRLDLFTPRHRRWRRRIGHLRAAFDALWALTKRNVSEAAQTGVPGIGGSVFKLSFSEHAQALGDLAMEMLDAAALCADPLSARRHTDRQRGAGAQLVQVDQPRPSRRAPHRCSATSWPSASSASRGRADGLPRRRGRARAGRGDPGHAGRAAAARAHPVA